MDEGWEGKVKIELIEGKDMEKADVEGTSDCYCIFSINWQTVKSSVFPNSLK
jgi:Ca2+-dependent lipid-binding protein